MTPGSAGTACQKCGEIANSLDEKCPFMSGIKKAYCAYFQGTARGTRDNPNFSMREFRLHGSPMVEILKDNAAVHAHDANFQFGTRKAEMLLACIDVLRKFWQSGDESRLKFQPQLVKAPSKKLTIELFVEMHPEFLRSDGVFVDRPFLQLQALEPHSERIGLGVIKCRAICEVEPQLRSWLGRVQR